MKKLLLFYSLALITIAVNAQEASTTADQNPNYKTSLEKYKSQQDKLVATMNTTVQDTYKAYDWYEAKQERKQQRIADRRERRLYELQNYGNYYNPYNYNYDPFPVPFRYSPYNFRYHHWRHR
jgi:Skp family chaperone for outer membrane proteins